VFVWVGGARKEGVTVVHHHSRNFACEQRTKKQEAEAGNKTTRTAVWISTLLGNVVLSA